MKRKLTLRTMLAAVMMVVGLNSAWAETVGSADNSTAGSKSTTLTLNNGGTVHYEFTATTKAGENGNGWILVANNGSDIVRLRCDNWELVAAANTGCFSSYDWTNFQTEMNGSSISMDVTLISNVFTMSATITASNSKVYPYRYIKYLDTAPASLNICLEANYAYLNITEGTSTDDQYEIKNTIFGAKSGKGVAVEDFSSATAESALITGWTVDPSDQGSMVLGNVTKVDNVAVEASVGGTASNNNMEGAIVPTYVDGNCVGLNKSNKNTTVVYATYPFSAVSSGYLVFNADTYNDFKTNPHGVCFIDGDGAEVLKIQYNNGNNSQPLQINGTNVGCNTYIRGFSGYAINGLVVNMATGEGIVMIDYIGWDKVRHQTKLSFNIGTGKSIAGLKMYKLANNYGNGNKVYLDNISLYAIGSTEAAYDYAIHYKVDGVGEDVKTTEGSDIAGTVVNAVEEFWVGDVKYVLNGTQTTSLTVTSGGSNELTINVKVAETFTSTVNAKAGETIIASPSNTCYSGEDVRVYYKKAYQNADTWYMVNANGSEPYYGRDFTNVAANSSYDVTGYTANANVVYYEEAEDMNISGSFAAAGSINGRYSNGVAKRLSKSSYIYTGNIPAGVYTVSMWGRNQSSSATATLALYLRDTEGNLADLSTSFEAWGVSAYEEKTSAEITVPNDGKTYSIAVYNTDDKNNSNLEADYVYVTLVRPAVVSKTITAAGWATYCSPYALDFSSSVANLDAAYIVTGGDGSVLTKTEVTGTVPANTGLLLKGEGECVIPVVASGDAANVSGNKLVGVTTETAGVAAGIYVLLNETSGEARGLGFYKTTNAFTVGANTAYLPDGFDGSGARAFYLFDDGDVTAIEGVKAQQTADGVYYNIAGQRVAQPKKGLYILNGRKVVVK